MSLKSNVKVMGYSRSCIPMVETTLVLKKEILTGRCENWLSTLYKCI